MVKFLAAIFVFGMSVLMAIGIRSASLKNQAAMSTDEVAKPEKIETVEIREKLEIYSPKDGSVVNTATVNLTGKTFVLADVFVNEKQTSADKDGLFSVQFSLDEGVNDVFITANNELGDVVEKSIQLIYEPVE